METIYVVQGFTAGKRGALVPLQAVPFKTEARARGEAARLSESCEGVIAFAQSADPETGDYDDPVILEQYGSVPEMA